ncbi:hypothetical protein BYT27DRAFT_7208624 [Phlegmacium glaucopus]|nr:hypothetical protein BYT27DRAFT_7208624 [Phlegmacium glaucopus]
MEWVWNGYEVHLYSMEWVWNGMESISIFHGMGMDDMHPSIWNGMIHLYIPWNGYGMDMKSISIPWNGYGMDMKSISIPWNGYGLHLYIPWNGYGMKLDSMWNMTIPYGIHSDYGMGKWLGTEPKVIPYGIHGMADGFHMDNMGECKDLLNDYACQTAKLVLSSHAMTE